jgi:hypothetical protein
VFGSLVVELVFDGDLLFHSVLRFTHLELVLVRVLIPCVPVVGVLSFFLLDLLREGYARYVTPYRVLVVPITSFLSSVRGLECPLFGAQGLS